MNFNKFKKNKIRELDEGNELEDFRKDKEVNKFFNKLRISHNEDMDKGD